MKKILLLSFIFLMGCSPSNIDSAFLRNNEWVGDVSGFAPLSLSEELPLKVHVTFHENTFDYTLDSNDLFNLILSDPDNDEIEDNSFYRMAFDAQTSSFINGNLEYEFLDNNFVFDPQMRNPEPLSLKLEKTSDGFEAVYFNEGNDTEYTAQFKVK